ncbi:MAG: CoA transferase, partial [Pseudomonadota bacterium]
YQAFQTSDGWLTLGASNLSTWEKFLTVIGDESLAADPRFATNADRMANLPALVEILNDLMRQRPTEDWLTALEAAGVPAGPVLSIADMHRHPQTIAREMVPTVTHQVAGDVQTIGLPVKFSATPGAVTDPAPTLGQHTDDVLEEFGFTTAEISALREAGAIG